MNLNEYLVKYKNLSSNDKFLLMSYELSRLNDKLDSLTKPIDIIGNVAWTDNKDTHIGILGPFKLKLYKIILKDASPVYCMSVNNSMNNTELLRKTINEGIKFIENNIPSYKHKCEELADYVINFCRSNMISL